MMSIGKTTLAWIAALSMLSLLACSNTKKETVSITSGFLKAPQLLVAGKPGQAEQVYINPDINWSQYKNVLLDPVTIWHNADPEKNTVDPVAAQKLADHFFTLIHNELGKDYKMVTTPEAKTLRISVAIYQLKESNVTMEIASTVLPQARLLNALSHSGSKPPRFVGQASVQVNITDAESNTLLAEGADSRVGNYTLNSMSMDSWSDVESMMEYWVVRSSYNLCKARDGTHCVAPKTH